MYIYTDACQCFPKDQSTITVYLSHVSNQQTPWHVDWSKH